MFPRLLWSVINCDAWENNSSSSAATSTSLFSFSFSARSWGITTIQAGRLPCSHPPPHRLEWDENTTSAADELRKSASNLHFYSPSKPRFCIKKIYIMILSQEAFLPSGDSVCVCFFLFLIMNVVFAVKPEVMLLHQQGRGWTQVYVLILLCSKVLINLSL